MGILGDIIGGVTSIIGGNSQKKAAKEAAAAQVASINKAIGYQDAQSNQTLNFNAPWLQAGTNALSAQNDLLGLGGGVDWNGFAQSLDPAAMADYAKNWSGAPGSLGDMSLADYGKFYYSNDGGRRDLTPFTQTGDQAQAGAISSIQNSPFYQSLYNNGQEAILQNASATGGLRGGNTQRGLANFGRDTLAQVIQQQLANLGGISSQGQQTAGLLGQLGQQSAGNLGQLAVGIGNAQAGNSIAQGRITNNQWQAGGSALGSALDGIFGGIKGGGSGVGAGAGSGIVVTHGGSLPF